MRGWGWLRLILHEPLPPLARVRREGSNRCGLSTHRKRTADEAEILSGRFAHLAPAIAGAIFVLGGSMGLGGSTFNARLLKSAATLFHLESAKVSPAPHLQFSGTD